MFRVRTLVSNTDTPGQSGLRVPWRDGTMVCLQGNKILRFGGWNNYIIPNTYSVTMDFTNPNDIQQLETAPWAGRHNGLNLELPSGNVLISGGDLLNGVQNDSWIRNSAGSWTQKSSNWNNIPDPVSGRSIGNCVLFASCLHKGKPYLVGGQSKYDNTATFNNSVWRTDDEGASYVLVADLPSGLQNRSCGVLMSMFGSLFYGGGAIYNNVAHFGFKTDWWRSDDDGLTWNKVSEGRPDMSCIYATGNSLGNIAIYMRGYTNETANTRGLFYSTDGCVTWNEVIYNPIPANHASRMIPVNGSMLVIHGNEQNGVYRIDRVG